MSGTFSKLSVAIAVVVLFTIGTVRARPLKVYILAGQSNMEGHARISTFDYLGDDPKTAPLLKQMRGADGQPAVADRVWISYLTGSPNAGRNGVVAGKLTAGFGARRNPQVSDGKIGPEFTFGLTMQQHYDGPILLIKTAWGGTSLHRDWRPPSNDKQEPAGHYYQLMIDHVKQVLADPKAVVPGYNARDGYEMAGFVWFQGWNDMTDGNTYPNRREPGGYELYSQLLAQFIRDVRKDLAAPTMPFVIGVIGVGGDNGNEYFRKAMAAPASLPEFQGNVVAVETSPFWDYTLAEIDNDRGVVNQVRGDIRKYNQNQGGNLPRRIVDCPIASEIIKTYQAEDGTLSNEQTNAFLEEYALKRIGPERLDIWSRGGSNAGYHYLGAAKILGPIGKAFADSIVDLKETN